MGGLDGDSLQGGTGNDVLDAGLGLDTMTGGAGNDIFKYGPGQRSHRITDFGSQYYTATMRGTFESPANGSPGQGDALLTLNRAQTSLTMDIVLGALSAGLTAMHIHNALPGTNGPVVFDIGTGTMGGQPSGTVSKIWSTTDTTNPPLTPTEIAALNNGIRYINAHTAAFPGGEVRGQILSQGTALDKIDVTAANIGEFATLQNFLSTGGIGNADALLVTNSNGQASVLQVTGLAGQLTANDFIFQTAITADNIVGTALIDDLFGAGGNDTLAGGGSSDRLYGESGNDRLEGGQANDTVNGGTGLDVAMYSDFSGNATWRYNANNTWTITTPTNGTDTVSQTEMLQLSDRPVRLYRLEGEDLAGDFNGDGLEDVLLRDVDGKVQTWESAASGATALVRNHGSVGFEYTVVGVGDFGGTGNTDDVLFRQDNGNLVFWSMNGSATGAGGIALPLEWHVHAVADFNGDSTDDLRARCSPRRQPPASCRTSAPTIPAAPPIFCGAMRRRGLFRCGP